MEQLELPFPPRTDCKEIQICLKESNPNPKSEHHE